MNKQIVIIILVSILLLLLLSIKIQIVRNNEIDKKGKRKNDINLYFFKLLGIRFDLDEFIAKVTKYQEKDFYDFIKDIKEGIEFIKNHQDYLISFLSIVPIKKITIIYQTNNPIVGVGCWNSIFILRNVINELFECVNNEYYNVQMQENRETNVKFEFVCTIRFYYIIYAFIINIIRKVKKRKGSVLYGKPSNKRFISNFNG